MVYDWAVREIEKLLFLSVEIAEKTLSLFMGMDTRKRSVHPVQQIKEEKNDDKKRSSIKVDNVGSVVMTDVLLLWIFITEISRKKYSLSTETTHVSGRF